MNFDLATLTRRARNPRRSAIILRDIAPPAMLATDLFRACYLPVLDAWREAVPSIVATYQRSLAELTTDSPTDLDGDIQRADGALQRLFILLSPRLRSWALRTEAWFRGRWRGAVLSATGVDLETMLGPEGARQSLEQAIAWNTSLIRDVSDQLRQRISATVFAGLQARQPAREVAAAIREASGMARDRSLRIASDQLGKLTSALADERRREAGLPVWKWRHSGKRHPRSWHKARDGHFYSEGARVGTVVNGVTVERAPAPDDLPGRPPFCGCRAQSVVVFD